MTRFLVAITFVVFSFAGMAQDDYKITWEKPLEGENYSMLWFNGANSGTQLAQIPSFCGEYFSAENGNIELTDMNFIALTEAEEKIVLDLNLSSDIEIISSVKKRQGGFLTSFCLVPVRRNPSSKKFEKLVGFNIQYLPIADNSSILKTTSALDSSVLATGSWYKIAVNSSGIYKITPQFLADCGFGNNLPSDFLRVFGNGNGLLPEANDLNPDPALKEVAIYVNDGGDGVFNGNDYALFYAVGPHIWSYNKNLNQFSHTYNIYSDQSFYFLTVNNGIGKRVQPVGYNPGSATYITSTADDYQFLEDDKYNLVSTGKMWFGDLFDFKLSFDYALQFSDVDFTDTAFFKTQSVARSLSSGTRMEYKVNNLLTATLNFPAVGASSGSDYVREMQDRVPFFPSSNTLNVNLKYNNAANASATAWLDYFSVQLRRNLALNSSSVHFRDRRAFRQGGNAQFVISNAKADMQVWDVTNQQEIRFVNLALNGTTASFIAPSDTLREFAALFGSSFPAPAKIGSVANQNLHALTEVEFVILTHPNFLAQAEELATFHRNGGLNVLVVTPELIYNEFSSGMQDITAIKLFLRHLYLKPSAKLKYLLLFGDASYDYKNRVANMHNFVPIFETKNSYSLYSSFCTDDFYGFLEDGEGQNMLTEDLDIAIGRMPVKTVAEATDAINKVFNYKSPKLTYGDWRNKALLIADDVDEIWEMDFVHYTDRLARSLDTLFPLLNVEKIYIDSYVQQVQAGSQRYPDARQDIFRKVEKGNLVTSYLGHGGEVGWAKERILQLADVTGWDNYENMPLFSTITCEFTRVDDPLRVSAGEQLFLNKKGGAIALYSTLRPVFATPSTYNLNRQLFEYMFYEQNGVYLTMGEVIQATKNNNNSGDRIRFALIGDPAITLAHPKNRVMTDSVNGQDALSFNDTLKALSKVRISGHIENVSGSLLSDFNGIITPTVYDKSTNEVTQRNDGQGTPIQYNAQESIIFKGKASVTNGHFSFEFVVPLDISFVVGQGKISYYASDSVIDANGYNKDLLIGSLDLNAAIDDIGPEVRVFINDTNFVNGGLTDKDPTSIALVADSSGINTVGNGIGHDIIGILDGETSAPYILNDYFESDLDSYQKGQVTFPFFDLEIGEHTLLVRAWDVNNNPGEGQISFIVDASSQLALNRVLNYPNPFSYITTFQFEHNRAGEPLEIDIQIFSANGDRVKRIQQELVSTGNRVNQITWDGASDSGAPLGSGVYIYRVQVKSTEDGSVAMGYSKLVYIK